MKPSLSYCILAVFSLVLAVAGCGRKNTASQVTPLENATNVQSVFQNASEDIKQQAGEVVAAVQSQNSVAAYTRLENLSGRSNLTPEQQQAILDMRMALVRQLQAESTKGNAAAEELLNKYRSTK
jgi:hypothetical protein